MCTERASFLSLPRLAADRARRLEAKPPSRRCRTGRHHYFAGVDRPVFMQESIARPKRRQDDEDEIALCTKWQMQRPLLQDCRDWHVTGTGDVGMEVTRTSRIARTIHRSAASAVLETAVICMPVSPRMPSAVKVIAQAVLISDCARLTCLHCFNLCINDDTRFAYGCDSSITTDNIPVTARNSSNDATITNTPKTHPNESDCPEGRLPTTRKIYTLKLPISIDSSMRLHKIRLFILL